MLRVALVVALLLASAVLPASFARAQSSDIDAALLRASHRGVMLFTLDRAAWVTTDDFREAQRDDLAAQIRGWIVEVQGERRIVTYYGLDAGTPYAIYVGAEQDGRVIERQLFERAEAPALTAAQLRLMSARGAATSLGEQPCAAAPFNAVVIPPDTDDGVIDVYLLTPQTRTDSLPAGGHFLVRVATGGGAERVRAFTNSCIELSTRDPRVDRVEALFITHTLDPTPTEIHVFTSMQARLPVFVVTGGAIWRVNGPLIMRER